MGIRDVIAKARRAQQQHVQLHPVQLEIEEETQWATYDEIMERFFDETYAPWELEMARRYEMGINLHHDI